MLSASSRYCEEACEMCSAIYRAWWKKADLKTVITTKRTKNNDNDNNNNSNSNENNNNNNNNNNGSGKNTNNNHDINNPFKVAYPQSLVHADQKQTIFKKKAQQASRKLTKKKCEVQATKTNKIKRKHPVRLD